MQQDPAAILKDLICLPSVNPMGRDDVPPELAGESRVAGYVEDFIRRLGLDVIVQQTGVPGERNVGGMLFRRRDRKTVVLESHMDTVDVGENQDLLTPVEKDGRIYGRGACDDKGSLAAMLAALAAAARAPSSVKNNIVVMAVADEEYSWRGSLALVAQEPTRNADFGLVGEPTGCGLVDGYKGIARWNVKTHGVAHHSSEPERGVNAIYRMARIVSLLEKYQKELGQITDDELGVETVSVDTIRGGTAVNVVPDSCVVEIDRRLTRLTTPEEARTAVSAYLSDHGIDFDFTMTPLRDAQRAYIAAADHPWPLLLRDISRRLGLDAATRVVGFGSDASRMNDAGIVTLLWGPGSVEVAHGTGEFVPVGDLERAAAFYTAVIHGERLR